MTSTLDAAQRYLSLGFSVVPIRSGSKAPAIAWKEFQNRFPHREELGEWFSQNNWGVGIVTGEISGIVVLDADSEKGVEEIECRLPDSFLTPIAQTPRGRHYFFKHPGGTIKNAVKLLDDVDVRGDGGLVVAPPGDGREWIVDPEEGGFADLSPKLAELMIGDIKRKSANYYHERALLEFPTGYGQAALIDECNRVRSTPKGSRNDVLNKAAYSLGQLVGGGALSQSTVEAKLKEAAQEAGLGEQEIKDAIGSGLQAGLKSPRTPPLASSQPNSVPENDDSYTSNTDTSVLAVDKEFDDKCRQLVFPIGLLRRGGMSEAACRSFLISKIKQADSHIIDRALQFTFQDKGDETKSLTQQVEEWVLSSPGDFESSDVVRELALSSRVDKKNLSKILGRLVDRGVIERVGRKRGHFRVVDRSEEVIDWRNTQSDGGLDLRFPLGLETHFEIMPGSVVVIAGSSNAGKTAFALNMVRDNQKLLETFYFSSSAEGNDRTLRKRVDQFGDPQEDWVFTAIRRTQGQFQDVIRPNGLNVIDYLEVHGEFYEVGGQIAAIHEKLDDGVAVICLQKNPKADFARGGALTQDKATVYINLDTGDQGRPNTLTIVKAKYPLGDKDCNGLRVPYLLNGGCWFEEATRLNSSKRTARGGRK